MVNNIRIIRPRRDDSCYEFEVQNQSNGRKSRAFLTYELFPKQTFERTLLLCEDANFFATLLTSPIEKVAYGTLNNLLRAPKHSKLGVTKSIVNQLVDGEFQMEGIRVAVHTFGPVPVIVLDGQVELQVHGRSVKTCLALFPKPNKRDGGSSQGFPFFVATKSEFRKCMSASPHLVFQRYFEDVAEDFHDLRRTLRQIDFYRRARSIERTLGASIGSKLKNFIPKESLDKSSNPEQKDAWEFFCNHAGVLYETAIAHSWSLFLLNEIYQTMGVFSLSQEYKDKITECHNHFAKLLGDKQANELRSKSRLIQFLDECQQAYYSVDLLQTGFMIAQKLFSLAKDAPGLWEKEITKFAAFCLIARTFQGSTRFVKIFISHHHEVPASEIIRDQIKNYVAKQHGDRIAALSVQDLPPGSPFRHIIRASIWLANGTIALCPSDTRTISATRDKDYKWIAREGEYTLLLKKPVLFGTQDGANRAAILDDLKNPDIEYLVKGSKLPANEERANNLRESFAGLVQAQFQANTTSRSSDHLDPRLKDSISTFIDDQSKNALETLFDGYFNQFETEVQRAMVIALAHLGYMGKKPRNWLVQQFAEHWKNRNVQNSEIAFERMWKQVRNRKLNISKQGLALLELPDSRLGKSKDLNKYHERFSLALRILRPEMTTKNRKSWREAWLNRWADKLRLERKCLWG
jgi:hypothetical protein